MIPALIIDSNANSTPDFTKATNKTPLSKYSCSEIWSEVNAVFSKAVSPVAALQDNKFTSSFAQSSIIVFEK